MINFVTIISIVKVLGCSFNCILEFSVLFIGIFCNGYSYSFKDKKKHFKKSMKWFLLQSTYKQS